MGSRSSEAAAVFCCFRIPVPAAFFAPLHTHATGTARCAERKTSSATALPSSVLPRSIAPNPVDPPKPSALGRDHLNRQWILDRMNRIHRIRNREVGITGLEGSTFDNSEIESLPLTPCAALGSLSPLRFDLVEKSVSARDIYNFVVLFVSGGRARFCKAFQMRQKTWFNISLAASKKRTIVVT